MLYLVWAGLVLVLGEEGGAHKVFLSVKVN